MLPPWEFCSKQNKISWDFPGGPEVRTPNFHYQGGPGLILVEDLRSHNLNDVAKKK